MDSFMDSCTSGNESEDDLQECENVEVVNKLGSLPERSRDKYLRAYECFNEWKSSKGFESYTEDVLLEYFKELAKTKKVSTLWYMYSTLGSTINLQHGVLINKYSKLKSFLKCNSKGWKPNKRSKLFTAQDVESFLTDAPDNIYLAAKVVIVFVLHGGCKPFEIIALRTTDIKKHSDKLMIVNVIDTSASTNRSFVIIREEYIRIVEKYLALRPTGMESDRFLVRYYNGKCKRQFIGKNNISTFPRMIAAYLNLPNPELFTGHCLKYVAKLSGLMQSSASSLKINQDMTWMDDCNADAEDPATIALKSQDLDSRPETYRTRSKSKHESTFGTQHEAPVETQHEAPVETEQFETNTEETAPQIKVEWSDSPAEESVKSKDGLEQDYEDNAERVSPTSGSSKRAAFRALLALERRRARLDAARARQLRAREERRLSLYDARAQLDKERNELLRKIADIACALLEKTKGNGVTH